MTISKILFRCFVGIFLELIIEAMTASMTLSTTN